MLSKAVLLALLSASAPVLAGQGGSSSSHNAASSLDEYCFYSIYTTLTAYTFAGSTTISSSSSGGETSHGSSSSSSTDSASSSSSSSVAVTPHGSRRSLLKRGHGGSSDTSTGPCNSTVEVTSLYASAKAWCDKKQLKATIPYWQSLCEQNSLTLMDLTAIEVNVTDEYIDSLSTIDPDQNSTTTTGTIESPVLLSHSYYKIAYKSYVTHDYAIPKDKRFGWGLMGYWGGVLVLGMISKAWTVFFSMRSAHSSRDIEARNGIQNTRKGALAPLASVYHFLRTHITAPATFAPALSNHQQLWFSHTIPKRVDTLIVFGFWAVSIILGCVDYESFMMNLRTPNLFQQNWQYTSDRTGILSYACLPFLWLFSGRNNIFLWATNFNVQSFNIFHRHVAWVATIFAVVHSINYSVVFVVYDGRYNSAWQQWYWYMGVVATILMCFMLFQSLTFFRRRWYETFIAMHVVFAIVLVYALFAHTSFDGTEWNGYLWAPVALWCFDWFMRFVRIAYCNFNVRFGKQFISGTPSTVTYSEESDMIKVEMTPGASTPRPGPGQHYFLYQPVALRGWENHPFTLGAYTSATGRKSEEENASASDKCHKLIFYIRPYDGWTRRLRDQCRKAKGVFQPKLLLEGPYGHVAPLHGFETVLMIMGGTGITAAVPYLIDHVARVKQGKTKTSRIQLVWSVRQRAMVDEVFSDEVQELLQHGDITMTVYCSFKASPSSSDSDSDSASPESKEGSKKAATTSSANVHFVDGRPNVRDTVLTEVAEAKGSSCSLGVLTCGPAKMADECRDAVYDAMKKGFQDIDYFEEAFGW